MVTLIDTPRYKLSIEGSGYPAREELLTSETSRSWQYVPHDHGALEIVANRLGLAARERATLTYGALVKNVTFCIPSINEGRPYQPNMDMDGSNVVRRQDLEVVDEFLTYLSLHSYKGADLIASALVSGPANGKPNAEFLRLARKLRRSTPRLTSDTELWTSELQRSFNYFTNLSSCTG
ncbi:hypothetical protein [Variovorax sp. 38R]|uniref:hypothetical protein n=1 Tax=Variovorax sp. 38R TaxID=2774875 RepID=UPI0017870096|nr:hypothetical protein [Variovorax sp. 38R]QOF77563.1 hypothetical protein IG196_24955 [Variovorax sp. 38R]